MSALAGIGAALEALAAYLRANALSADVDPTKINAPGIWVSLGTISPDLLDGNGHIEIMLHLVVPDAQFPDVLRMLDQLLGKVLDLVDVVGDVVLQPVLMPDGSTLPGVRATVLTDYQRTDDDD